MSNRTRGYTHAIVVRLKDKAALQTYTNHPLHLEAKKLYIGPILDPNQKVLAMDFESGRVYKPGSEPTSTARPCGVAAVSGLLGFLACRMLLRSKI